MIKSYILFCWILQVTNSIITEFIIIFYDIKRKEIIKYGSSEIGCHSVLGNIHAEEIALTFLVKYMRRFSLKKSYMNNIILYIWKIKKGDQIKPASCCAWCKGIVSKYGFPYENVKTYQEHQTILDNPVKPLMKSEYISK